ncbi:MAG: D-glycerate dehydrogenase [Gemmatimonadota bacterium]
MTPGAKPVVVVTRRLPARVESELAAHFDARLNESDTPLSGAALRAAMRDADAMLCTVTDRIDAVVLAPGALRCRVLANFGVGFDHVDVTAARERGIVVTNTPDVLTEATADLTIALMLAVARRIGEGERLVRAGEWHGWAPTAMLGRMVSGATLGIIGYGRIGRAVAARAQHGFGMRVLFHTPHPPADTAGAEPCGSLEELLAASDFVSLHCRAMPETRHLIDRRHLGMMHPRAYLINTARGEIVDEAALADALRTRRIAGAALDVHAREPEVSAELLALENVVLLPHLGSATEETRVAMGLRALDNLRAFFAGGVPPDRVA